jgi:excisionase family DNA binding protein
MGNAMHIKSKKHGDIERLGVSVEEMGRALGIGRNAAYEAVRRGDIPAIRIGRRLIVPIEALRKKLEEAAK